MNVGTTSLEVQWTDNATFEGSYQVFRKRVDYDGNVTDDRNLRATEAQSAESHADSEVQPGREYEYVVRARTSWVHADTSIGTVSTDSISLSDRAVSPRGWHLEVDHPSGTTLTPDPLDGATRRPTINGFPRVEIPVPYRDRWHSADRDDAPLRVWHSGSREPIETLEHRRLEEGAGSKRTVLEGRGGTQLDRRVIEDVDIEPTHEFAKRLIEEYTDYTATVDDPQTNQEERALDRAESAFEYGQTLQAISDTTPLKITDDGFFECKQTCWSFDAVGNTTATVQSDSFTGGEAAQITDFQDSFSVTFETDYRIEEPEFFHRGIREAYMRMDIYVDGVLATSNLQTAEPGYAPISFAGPLEPGSHTIEFDVQPDGTSDSGDFRLDRFGVRDAQFSYDDSGTLNEPGGHTDGPSPYPDLTRIETVEYTTPLAMTEVSVDAQPTAGSVAELGIRQDGTGDYVTASQTTSHTIQYNDLAATAQARIGLGRRQDLDPRDETPRLGYESQRLDILEISALLDDTPVLTDRSFDRPLIDVLREVADIGNFVFEVRADGDETVIEWTQLGQREVSIDPEIADYSVDRQTEDVVEKAVVYGSAAQITRQTVDVAIGTWVDLPFPDAKIVERKETIYDGDTEFTRGEDYQIRYATEDGQPRIKALSGGALSDGQTVSVDAEVKPRGSYTEGDAGENPKTVIEDIPGLASKQMCDQYALYAVERTGDAIVDASVTISSEEVGALLVDAIDIDRLPGDVPWEVDDISYGDGEVSIELGNGPSADDFLQGLSDRLQRNSERV
ncbi:hypothetical protein DVR14_23995 (plasmid) [Natrinema thermotolerans]|nr:hypothetical protein DVR14_23995 [Natrinema thermotolerans]